MAKSKKEAEAFEEWKEEISATLEGKELEAFSTLVANEAKGKNVFRGYVREQEFYTRLNEIDQAKKAYEAEMSKVKAKENELQSWYTTEGPKNAQLIEEKQKLVARLASARQQLIDLGLVEEAEQLGAGPISPTASSPIQHDDTTRNELRDLRAKIETFDKAIPVLLGSYGKVIAEVTQGKWDVSPDMILSYAVQNGVDPQTAFYDLTAEQRAGRDREAREKEIAKAKEEGRREALTQRASPDFFRQAGPSAVETLRVSAPQDRNARVNAAVGAFLEDQGSGR